MWPSGNPTRYRVAGPGLESSFPRHVSRRSDAAFRSLLLAPCPNVPSVPSIAVPLSTCLIHSMRWKVAFRNMWLSTWGPWQDTVTEWCASGPGGGARCCRCVVVGALLFFWLTAFKLNTDKLSIPCNWTKENYEDETRHPTHRRYRWWSGMLKGAVAGASPTGPWTDRRTGVRTPVHDERQPWHIPLDRPCLLPKMALGSFMPRNENLPKNAMVLFSHSSMWCLQNETHVY